MGVEDSGFLVGVEVNSQGGTGVFSTNFSPTIPGMYEFITQLLEVVGVQKWDNLKGVPVRVRMERGLFVAIGHFMDDKWLVLSDFWNKYQKDQDLPNKFWRLKTKEHQTSIGSNECLNEQIVRAPTENLAREMAGRHAWAEGMDIWLRPYQSTCVEIPAVGDVAVIEQLQR
jgi:hypothetical protein